MGLRSIFRGERRDEVAPTTRQRINRDAISGLFWIISIALLGIISLSFWGLALRYGVLGSGEEQQGGVADEALSILGNVASAAVGGLVGWLTRDQIVQNQERGGVAGFQSMPLDEDGEPIPVATPKEEPMPLPIEADPAPEDAPEAIPEDETAETDPDYAPEDEPYDGEDETEEQP